MRGLRAISLVAALAATESCTQYGPSLLETQPRPKADSGVDACGNNCAPSCSDGVRNGAETDVDCGGGACKVCDALQACALTERDCPMYTTCSGGRCINVSCSDGLMDAHETDVDCGGGECEGCGPDKTCVSSSDCAGGICDNRRCVLASTCGQIHARNTKALDGVLQIDVDGPAGPLDPFLVYCDMTTAGGGWTQVGFEPSGSAGLGVQGALAFLAADTVDASMLAYRTSAGVIGSRFSGKYTELMIQWGTDYVRATVSKDIFVNQVDKAIALTNFETSNAQLSAWVKTANGADFCRASSSPDESPGETSWAVKPLDNHNVMCGCSGPNFADRGLFYGGGIPNTSCMAYGGGFAGVKDDKVPKGGLMSTTDVSLWVR